MAKKTRIPTDDEILETLIAQKRAAGLSEDDAVEVAQRQIEHDKGNAEREAAEAARVADVLGQRAITAQAAADQAAADAAAAQAATTPPAE